MKDPDVPGVPKNARREHFSTEPRSDLQSVQASHREGAKLLFQLRAQGKAHESHFVVYTWLCANVISWTRLVDKVAIKEIAEETGLHRNSIGRVLHDLTDFGVLHWMPGTSSASFVSMAPDLPAESLHTPDSAKVEPSLHTPDCAPLQVVGRQEGETDAPDFVRAARSFSEHLFHGKHCQPELLGAMTKWFADLPPDSIDDVRARATSRKPGVIRNAEKYARKVFDNAVAEHHRKIPRPAVSRETLPNSWDRSIDSSLELQSW